MVEVSSKPVPTCWEVGVCVCVIYLSIYTLAKGVCVCVCMCEIYLTYTHWPNFMVGIVSQEGMSGYA